MNLIEHNDTYDTWSYEILNAGSWLHVMLYMCMVCIIYTIRLVNSWEIFNKKELPISVQYMEEYQKSRVKFRRCVMIPPIEQPPHLFVPFDALNFWMLIKYLNPHQKSLFLISTTGSYYHLLHQLYFGFSPFVFILHKNWPHFP